MISTDCVDANCCWFTWAVLTLIYVHTLVVREDVARLTPAAGHMVRGGAGPTATAHYAACINTPVVSHLTHLVTTAVSILFTLNLCTAEG